MQRWAPVAALDRMGTAGVILRDCVSQLSIILSEDLPAPRDPLYTASATASQQRR